MRKLLTALLCLSLAAGPFGVSAYLSAETSAVNPVDVGLVTSAIVEEFDPPAEVLPGSVIPKKVRIQNTGPAASCVRVRVLFSDSAMEELCSLDYDTASWTYSSSEDRWYLNEALPSGELSPPLFTAVTVSASASAEDVLPFDIYVIQESRQDMDGASVFEAWA